MKHLTFKMVFLLALGSGKRRSEIHVWQNRNIRHQSDWSKVSLYPSPSFLSKNQLAKEGPDSVAPVVIPALVPTLDRSLKSDRSLCPVRALRYYLIDSNTPALDPLVILYRDRSLLHIPYVVGRWTRAHRCAKSHDYEARSGCEKNKIYHKAPTTYYVHIY